VFPRFRKALLGQNCALNTIIGELSVLWRKEVDILRKEFFTLTPPSLIKSAIS